MSLEGNNKALGETNELLDNESITDLSLAYQPYENPNLADNSTLLKWSTYLGGSGSEKGFSIAVDSQDNVIVTGETRSSDFPVLNAYDGMSNISTDYLQTTFISKFDSSGVLLWSTYFGGSDDSEAYSIAVDSQDCIVLTGNTQADDFPVLNGFDETLNGRYDVFVAKLDSSGKLLWSTFLGGSSTEMGNSIAVDSQDDIIVTGYTSSSDFPTLNGYDESYNGGENDIFITKFNASGGLVWSTFFGGANIDYASSVAIDSQDNIAITGYTEFVVDDDSDNEVVESEFDIFITKFDSSGNYIWNNFFGGSSHEMGKSLAFDSQDAIVVAGYTWSKDFDVMNGFDESYAGGEYYGDAFITKFDPLGEMVWSTFLGGKKGDAVNSVAINSYDAIVVTGITFSSDFPVVGGFDESFDGEIDAFITKFNSSGRLVWSTYLGSSNYDFSNSVAIDSQDSIIVIGVTTANDFPVLNAYDEFYNGLDLEGDVFITKMLNPMDYTYIKSDSKVLLVIILFALGIIALLVIIYRRKKSI
ncbi:MAG: SBBP repeat-containing protein [Candidatus Kariarchaeaceae archaeon]